MITKNDDETEAPWAIIYKDPPYPLQLEFRAPSNPVAGLYVVDDPTSTPLMCGSKTPFGYEEHVPIHICTVDSTDVTGTVLQWKMEHELRYVCQEHPEGSRYTLELVRSDNRALGSMMLYDKIFMINYRRLTTT